MLSHSTIIIGNDTIIPVSFLPFGSAHGDSTVPRIDDGSTEEIQLETDIVFFGSRQNALYVSLTVHSCQLIVVDISKS